MDLSQGRAHNSERDDTDILVGFKEWLRAQDGQKQIAATQQQIAADQEQIAARQQQVLQQMATLQAAEVALTEKLSAAPKATTAAVAPRNSKNKPPLPQAGVRSPSGASSAPRNGTPLQLR